MPQNRARVYVVGRRKAAVVSSMRWPVEKEPRALRDILDQDGCVKSLEDCLPPRLASSPDGGLFFRNVLGAIVHYQAKQGRKIGPSDLADMIINDGGVNFHYNIGYSPCLTATRCKVGFWIPAQGRRMRINEIARLQGIDRPLQVNVARTTLGHMYGNAFTLPVVREVLRGALETTALL